MKYFLIIYYLFGLHTVICACTNDSVQIIEKQDYEYLRGLSKAVLDSSTVIPLQFISHEFGYNKTGGTIVCPGGKNCYPAFWIRDYAMSLNSGLIDTLDQKHMLLLTAKTQCNKTWITKEGGMIPLGSIADHILLDSSLPIYYPGTYDFNNQGNSMWGKFPPYCDQYFFIHMAYYYLLCTDNIAFMQCEIEGFSLYERLELSFRVPPTRFGSEIVYTTENYRGVDFGFRDAIQITGDLCMASILKYKAAEEMAEISRKLNFKAKEEFYKKVALALKEEIPLLFQDDRGMLKASTGDSSQADVWSTALAVYFHVLEKGNLLKAANALLTAYRLGTLSYQGNIRHILTTDDYNEQTAWEKTNIVKNTYQNGAYWGTATGWVCYAIAQVDKMAAKSLAKEYICGLKSSDMRSGKGGAPYECIHPSGYVQNPLYLTTVTCPLEVFQFLMKSKIGQ